MNVIVGAAKRGYRSVRWSNSHQPCGAIGKSRVTILGTQVADLDRAEDRDLFEQALKDLDIPQPPGQTYTNEE